MKVILLEDVKGTGKKDEMVDVKQGFAENFLIPNKKAVLANKENIEKLKIKKENLEAKRKETKENSKNIANILKDKVVEIKVKAGEDGKLFGTVTNKDIEEKLLEDFNIKIDRKRIKIQEKIKLKGEYKVDIKLEEGIETTIKVLVKGE